MKISDFWLGLVLLGLTSMASAEVVHAADRGFEIKSSVSIPGTPEQAYHQFLKVDEWWSPDHTWFGAAENLTLEPKAGGCFCEISADQSVLHMTVSYVAPGREFRMLGGLGPLQEMGLQGVLIYKFIPVSDHETRIVQIYRVNGYAPGGLASLAPIVDRVQSLQLNRLRDLFAARL